MASKKTTAEVAEAQASLKKLLKPGDTVHCILRHVSSSGMFRVIDLVIPYTRVDEYADPALEVKSWHCGKTEAYATTGPKGFVRGILSGHGGRAAGESCAITYPDGETVKYPIEQVKLYRKVKRPALRSIGYLAAKAMGDRHDSDRSGIAASGCGMDMGFNLVYNLGATLWPKGTPKPHGKRNGEPDRSGGYALKHSWL